MRRVGGREGPREAAGVCWCPRPALHADTNASLMDKHWQRCLVVLFPEARNVFLRMSCQLPRMVLHVILIALGQKDIVL